MNALDYIFERCAERAYSVALDCALDKGWKLEVVPDEYAEHMRVRAAIGPEVVVEYCRGIPYALEPVRCAGLSCVEPSPGGKLKAWIAQGVARLWRRRGGPLFRYVSASDIVERAHEREVLRDYENARPNFRNNVAAARAAVAERRLSYVGLARQRRWETRDYVELGEKFSPAYLSGFAPNKGVGKNDRGVSSPRSERAYAAMQRAGGVEAVTALSAEERTQVAQKRFDF